MLISDEYKAQQESLHSAGNYGTASAAYAPLVSEVINKLEVTHILDYGCGANTTLARNLKVKHKLKYQAYGPAVERFAADPAPAEMVACIDVLEHIEPDCINEVLDHIKRLAEAVVFVSIHTGPAVKVLPDGRNAHILQRPLEWWLPKLMERFEIQTVQVTGEYQFYVLAYSRSQIEFVDGSKA